MDDKTFEKHLKASNLAKLLAQGEEDIAAGRTREMGQVLRAFKRTHRISSKGFGEMDDDE